MIVRLTKRNACHVGQAGDNPRRELGIGAHAGAHRGTTERQLMQDGGSLTASAPRALDLAGIAQEFLAEPDRSGVLEMRAPGFDNAPELVRLGAQRPLQHRQRGDQIVGDQDRRGDVDGRGDDVVARLTQVDVVIGMHRVPRTPRAPEKLDCAVADHLVGVHVGRRSASRLKHIHDELRVQLPGDDILGCSGDGTGQRCVEQAQVAVDQGRVLLDHPERADEGARHPQVADRKV